MVTLARTFLPEVKRTFGRTSKLRHGLIMKLIFVIIVLATTLSATGVKPEELVTSARTQIGRTVSYDPAYRKLDYPGGDVPLTTGVCSDVIVRALRAQGVDLQKLVHEDMKRAFDIY